jgi:transketolase
MRLIPCMNLIVPCDAPQTREAVLAAASMQGPFYIRIGRSKVPTVENKGPFVFGKAQILSEGTDVGIIACGVMIPEALIAVEKLRARGIKARLVNVHTIRPLDTEAIIETARLTRCLVVCEEHAAVGGLASSVDEVVSEHSPVKVVRVGVRNRFGQSGEPAELMKEYNLTSDDIEKAVGTSRCCARP